LFTSRLAFLAVWPGVKHRHNKHQPFPIGCFMSGTKKRYFRVFTQFVPFPSHTAYFAHYYPITAETKPSPTVRTLGDTVSVFQYTDTEGEAAVLVSSMLSYTKNNAFLSLPHYPAFNGGQQFLF